MAGLGHGHSAAGSRISSRGGSGASTPRYRQDHSAGFDGPGTPPGSSPNVLPMIARPFGAKTPNTFARGTYKGLETKIAGKVEDSMAIKDEMERLAAEVRETYQRQLMLLKEMELERIELQAAAHWFASTRRNWADQHRVQGVEPSPEVEAKLAQEQHAAEAALKISDQNLRLLTGQVARLRKARDALDQQLVERRRQMFMEATILNHTSTTLKHLEARLMPWGSHSDFKVPPIGQTRSRPGSNTPSLGGSFSAR